MKKLQSEFIIKFNPQPPLIKKINQVLFTLEQLKCEYLLRLEQLF